MKELQTLKFYWLKYEVSAIKQFIKNSPGIDEFVFTYYFPESYDQEKPLQLAAYTHMVNPSHPDGVYSTHYDILAIDHPHNEEIGGPVLLSNNVISLTQMLAIIESPEKPDYLVFIPGEDQNKHVYYTIKGYKHTSADDIAGDTPPDQTNPSPPAK